MRTKVLLLLAAAALVAAVTAGAAPTYAQSGATGPTLTVVGYGLANLTPSTAATPAELNLNLLAGAPAADAAVAALRADVAALEKALMASGVTAAQIQEQGPPGLNYVTYASQANCQQIHKLKGIPGNCTAPGFTANETLQVQFTTLTKLASTLTGSGAATLPGVQNFYIGSGGTEPATVSPAAQKAAYAQALQDANSTASLLAAADHLSLGPALSIREGAQAGATACGGAMACGPVPLLGLHPPQAGPNQEVIAITVTYQTSL